jgi:arylsulfatase A-like enzyme
VDQLYDLEKDPFEQVNLIGQPAQAETLAELKQQLRELLATLPHTSGEFKTK